MPLYVNTAAVGLDNVPEIRRVIPGHAEADRCEQSPSWERITEAQLGELRDGADLAEVLAAREG